MVQHGSSIGIVHVCRLFELQRLRHALCCRLWGRVPAQVHLDVLRRGRKANKKGGYMKSEHQTGASGFACHWPSCSCSHDFLFAHPHVLVTCPSVAQCPPPVGCSDGTSAIGPWKELSWFMMMVVTNRSKTPPSTWACRCPSSREIFLLWWMLRVGSGSNPLWTGRILQTAAIAPDVMLCHLRKYKQSIYNMLTLQV